MTEPQEPVAWLSVDCIGERYLGFSKPIDNDPARPLVFGDEPQQAAPQQAAPAELKPLTEGQIGKLYRESAMRDRIMLRSDWEQGVRDAEAAHGIKGDKHGAE